MSKEFDVDVVVVGGGPVGLTLACELRLAGVEVTVLERRSARVSQSRALTIHGRTLEMLELRGLAGRFLARGIPIPMGHYAVLDTRLDFSVFETNFPFTLFLPQLSTEELLEQRARELGVRLELSTQVEQVVQDEGGVSIVAQRQGAGVQLRARYVVGADGARSLVRSQAGIAFPGVDAANTLALGDVVLDAPPPAKTFTAVNRHGLLMLAPLGDGKHHRIVLFDAARAQGNRNAPLQLEELLDSARRIGGSDFGAHTPIWLSRFTDETRLAEQYRSGRIFLAGDAAHMHMPAGGQGMNVGMQDAMNLGWKLGAVLRGHAGDSLLDSYHKERHPVGLALYHNTLAQSALITGCGDERGLALRASVNAMLQHPGVNRMLADQLSGFGVAYDTPLALPAGGPAAWIGRRMPDWPLRLADGGETTLYAQLADAGWVLLELAPGEYQTALAPGWCKRVRATPLGEHPELAGAAAILVRPDGYSDGIFLRRP